jgi:hypothetical protein
LFLLYTTQNAIHSIMFLVENKITMQSLEMKIN